MKDRSASFGCNPLRVYIAIRLGKTLTRQIDLADHVRDPTRKLFRMPFYLVTHISLIEGENEVQAAHAVLAKLRSDGTVQFTVKADEATVRQVTVANAVSLEHACVQPINRQPLQEIVPGIVGQVGSGGKDHAHARQWRQSSKGIVVGVGLFAGGLCMGLFL